MWCARCVCENGNSKVVSNFKSDFPKLNESIIRPWLKKYKSELSSQKPQTCFTIIIKRGRPAMFSEELDQKLRVVIVNLRTAGAVINIHVVRGVLAGIVRSNLENLDSSQICKWQDPGFAQSIIVRIFLEEQLLQVDQSSLSHYGKRLILNICMTLHQPFEPAIFPMSWYWMQTKNHQSMYPQQM